MSCHLKQPCNNQLIFETFYGDHMCLMGGFFNRTNIREIYPSFLDTINNIG